MSSSALWFSSIVHHSLALVEQLFTDEWLERSLMEFAIDAHEAAEDRILEYLLDSRSPHELSVGTSQTFALKEVSDRIERVVSCCIQLKGRANEWSLLRVSFDIPCLRIVDVPCWSKPAPLASLELLSDAPLHILGEVVHVQLRLSESDHEHEFPLWCVVEGHGREEEVLELPAVQKMDDATSVNGVSGQSIGVPRKNCLGLSTLDHFQHPSEHGSPRALCGFGLLEGGNDFDVLSGCKISQLTKLRFYRKNLSIFLLRGFANVYDCFHRTRVSESPLPANGKAVRCSGKRKLGGAFCAPDPNVVLGGACATKS